MERWEPPRSTGTEEPRRRRPAPEKPKRDVPETGLVIAVRLGISLVFLTTVLIDDLRDLMAWVVPVLVAGLAVIVVQSNNDQTRTLRNQTILDLGILVVVVPVLVLNGFVAAEPGSLLPAEQSALLQTAGALLIVVALMIWLAVSLFPLDRSFVPAAMLPGLIAVLSINFVLHDYRNQTVLAMLAVSYFIAAASNVLGSIVEEPVRRHVPATFYVATVLAGLVLFDPGLTNVFDRDAIVQMSAGLMILIALAALFIIPNPSFDQIRLGASGRPGRSRNRRQGTSDNEREADDSSGDTSRGSR